MSKGPNYKLYEFFGVELGESNGSGQFVTDCPFCGREKHFYVGEENSLYRCQDAKCGEEGNPYTFLEKTFQIAKAGTTDFALKRLSYKRQKFHKEAYHDPNIAWCKDRKTFLFADRNTEGRIVNLAQWRGEPGTPVIGAPDCSQHLFGLDELQEKGPIFICEGRWDRLALRWLLKKINFCDGQWTVLGAPGATNMPKGDLKYLEGRDIYLLYDNDEAGRNGTKIAIKKLSGTVGSIHLLDWQENRFPDKYDIEDYVRDTPDRLDAAWIELLSWCYAYQPGADPTVKPPRLERNTIDEILQDFTDTGIHMYPGLTDFLVLSLGVVHSTRYEGEPLWLYGIGDPGRGKSLVLESTLASPSCLYRTSVTHKAFISGFRNEGNDVSLLNLLPGKALIVKDWSNVLSLPHVEQEQLVALLREAYDGKIIRNYGNNVYREYPPADSPFKDCRFSVVAGVTKEIHGRSHAGLGERFLKYEIPCTQADNIRAMMAALDDSWKTHERQVHRAAAVSAFLNRNLPANLPVIPKWFKERLIAVSQFVGLSRSPVSRTNGDLDYSPSPESGTRVAKQLLKFAHGICLARNLSEADTECYRLIKKVAWDTAHGWRRELYRTLYDEEEHLNSHQIAEISGLSLGTTHRQLHDMKALQMVTGRRNGKMMDWMLTPHARDLVTQAHLEDM